MMERKGSHVERRKGGSITMPFIFANEACEKLAVVGFGTNMISYLTGELHMPLTTAANTLTNFGGTASLTPLLGAFISDAYAGRFWTITVASIIYQIGMTSLTISAVLPNLRPPPCKPDHQVCQQANSGQLAILYISLLLAALGAGGIRPCVVAFGADQFDETDPKQKTKTWNFFNWYYFCMGASILVAVTVVVYIQDNIGWGWGLGIPTIAMFLSVITFVIGYPLYRNLDPSGSPFTRLVQVSVSAFKKRNLRMVSDPKLLYENHEMDASFSMAGKLLHTKHMKFKGFWGVHVARACMVCMREAGNQSWKVEVGSLRHKGTGIDTQDPLYRYPLSNKGHFDSRKSGYRYRQFLVSIPRAVQHRFNSGSTGGSLEVHRYRYKHYSVSIPSGLIEG